MGAGPEVEGSRRDALAEVTAQIVADVGLAGLNMRDVAAAAGVTTGSLTHHFPARRDLVVFTFQSSLQKVRDGIERELQASDDRLRTRLMIGLPLDEERLIHWRLLCALVLGVGSDQELADLQRRAYRSYLRAVERCVQAEIESGTIRRAADAGHEARRLMAVMDGIAVQALFDIDRWPAERQLEVLDAQLRDLRA